MDMKKILTTLTLMLLLVMGVKAQTQPAQQKIPTNRYSMKLEQQADGSYKLKNEARYAKLVDLSQIEDLLVPYQHENKRLAGRDYKGVESREVVYRTHDGYELMLSIDLPISEDPTPVMFYLHGGGWARGTKDSPRVLSHYLAKQKGVAGVRVAYSLAPQPGATVERTIEDVAAAVEYIRQHARELNIDPSRMGFWGNSAGAHLAAVAAMTTPEAKVFVGQSGIYDLQTAAIVMRARQEERIAYFCDRNPKVLQAASPISLIPKKHQPAVQLFCGTADITVECAQSRAFAEALERKGAKLVDLRVYENYDHNLAAKASDRMEEIFFLEVEFIAENL